MRKEKLLENHKSSHWDEFYRFQRSEIIGVKQQHRKMVECVEKREKYYSWCQNRANSMLFYIALHHKWRLSSLSLDETKAQPLIEIEFATIVVCRFRNLFNDEWKKLCARLWDNGIIMSALTTNKMGKRNGTPSTITSSGTDDVLECFCELFQMSRIVQFASRGERKMDSTSYSLFTLQFSLNWNFLCFSFLLRFSSFNFAF